MATRRLAAAAAVVLAALAGPVLVGGCGGPTATTVRKLIYCHNGSTVQTMTVFEPTPAPTVAVPAVMDVHGGGWVTGDARLIPGTVDDQVKAALVDLGWVFVSIDYRLAPAYKWPAQIDDAKCAVRYLRAHAATLHVDPHRIGAIGASAGGHLAAMLGLAGPTAGFDVGTNLDQSSAVDAVVDEYGPTDLEAPSWDASEVAPQVTSEVFGVPLGQPSPVLAGASPVTYVTSGAPPFLVVHGADDVVVLPAQSEELIRRLHAAGDPATLLMVANAGHGLLPTGDRPLDPTQQDVVDDVTAFFEREL